MATGASQCGYCSPGIVMKAEALLRREPSPDRAAIGRQALQRAATGLSLPLLSSRLSRARERLVAARLAPELRSP